MEIVLRELVQEAADVGISSCLLCDELLKCELLTWKTLMSTKETTIKKCFVEAEMTENYMLKAVKAASQALIVILRSNGEIKKFLRDIYKSFNNEEMNQLATSESGLEAEIAAIGQRRQTFEKETRTETNKCQTNALCACLFG